ncbi:molybdopterin-synthase adenylyltransferase MoeB [Salinimonas marina]|uniref:Molybdopterin-synthase adenylyltransferase MoeB n=1 Tax=Salinimonas marina TaxID=2785918 RepID=A0A7S9DZX8_9ALTE|nr:molybdopterin-synthase adenylyltransferase MoeB [Salinimonas marina]QPG06768.1 molybdopterin-synthase adenylyltransferase MoeB [Salinimonas marina]
MSDSLNKIQAMRYNRQIVLPQIDLDGQERLLNARVLVMGVGGLGCHAAQSLVASGVGQITLVDDDTVSATNLPRQILFTDASVGQSKVTAARQRLQQLNPDCQINCRDYRPDPQQLDALARQHDVVLDCTDHKTAREQINHSCVNALTPLVSGAAIRFEGQLFVSRFEPDMPCYHCLGNLFTDPVSSCTESGIFSPVVAIIGLQQALIAMQLLAQFGQPPLGKLVLFDALCHQWQTFTVPKSAACSVCGSP